MKVYKCRDYDEISEKASQLIIKKVIEKPNAILGLATGSSPIGIYEHLIQAYKHKLVTFKDVKTFNLDEYIGIDRNHPQSYYAFMHRHLFDHIDILEENIQMPSNDNEHLNDLASAYNAKMQGNQRDIQLLGIGANAHIGFNEPKSKFSNQTFIVKLDENTREANARFFDSIDEVPTHAITMGIKNIMDAKKIILVASGKEKADAVYNMIFNEVTEDVPASILQLHPNVTVFLDQDAASKLKMKSDFIEI